MKEIEMTALDTFAIVIIAVLVWVTYCIGGWFGEHRQRKRWEDHMNRCNRYIYAVDNLDKWCGHTSPHAKLIARHLRAEGDGLGLNAGTPSGDEACTIDGLREQLKRLDAK